MEKQQSFHHSVTVDGNIQIRIITEYIKDGKSQGESYGNPMTPSDTKNMAGWDDRSKDIVSAITDEGVLTAFKAEKQEPTGNGIEEIIVYDREIKANGRIDIRQITRIFDEGKVVSKRYHRSWIFPGDNPDGNDAMSKALAVKLHTPEIIAAYKAEMEEVSVNA